MIGSCMPVAICMYPVLRIKLQYFDYKDNIETH
jgi:hypothetical protein